MNIINKSRKIISLNYNTLSIFYKSEADTSSTKFFDEKDKTLLLCTQQLLKQMGLNKCELTYNVLNKFTVNSNECIDIILTFIPEFIGGKLMSVYEINTQYTLQNDYIQEFSTVLNNIKYEILNSFKRPRLLSNITPILKE